MHSRRDCCCDHKYRDVHVITCIGWGDVHVVTCLSWGDVHVVTCIM